MDAITYTQARHNFTATMNKVCQDHAPIIITRQNEAPVVMMSLADYNAIEETMYLLKSPRNASRLRNAIIAIEERNFIAKDLLENNE
jgi:antitoxin YefM